MTQESLGRMLRVLRAEKGLTLQQAAALVGVNRTTLSDIEKGHRLPLFPTLAKLAQGYEVPVIELLDVQDG